MHPGRVRIRLNHLLHRTTHAYVFSYWFLSPANHTKLRSTKIQLDCIYAWMESLLVRFFETKFLLNRNSDWQTVYCNLLKKMCLTKQYPISIYLFLLCKLHICVPLIATLYIIELQLVITICTFRIWSLWLGTSVILDANRVENWLANWVVTNCN